MSTDRNKREGTEQEMNEQEVEQEISRSSLAPLEHGFDRGDVRQNRAPSHEERRDVISNLHDPDQSQVVPSISKISCGPISHLNLGTMFEYVNTTINLCHFSIVWILFIEIISL